MWQSYVDDELVCDDLTHSAIVGRDGRPWASSPGFGLTPDEGARIAQLHDRPDDAFASGIMVAGVRYQAVEAEERSIRGMRGAGGVICIKTRHVVIIGVYAESRQSSRAATVIEKLGEYFVDNGY